MRRRCLERLGSLISEAASFKALSRSGWSTMWISIVDPADGWPRVSQLTGMSCQVSLISMSLQGTTGVTRLLRGIAARKQSTMSQKCSMSPRGQPGMCGLEFQRFRDPERNAEMMGMQGFCGAFHLQIRGCSEAWVTLKYRKTTATEPKAGIETFAGG